MPAESIIRIANVADLDRVMAVLEGVHKENGFVSMSQMKVLGDVWSALNQDNGLIGIIEAADGEIEGVVVLRLGKMWYSNDDVLEEKLVYVPPQYRAAKGGRARRLCDFSKSISDKIGIPLIIGVLSNERTKGKMRMYERIFGAPAGAFFLYGASTLKNAGQES